MSRTVTCKVCGFPFSGESFPNGHICPSCNKKRAKVYRSAKHTEIDRRRKLTLEQVKQIRALRKQGKSMNELAQHFKVGKGTVVDIVNERSWKR